MNEHFQELLEERGRLYERIRELEKERDYWQAVAAATSSK
jgi:uncharacterized protein YdcH (DUF465 family)